MTPPEPTILDAIDIIERSQKVSLDRSGLTAFGYALRKRAREKMIATLKQIRGEFMAQGRNNSEGT